MFAFLAFAFTTASAAISTYSAIKQNKAQEKYQKEQNAAAAKAEAARRRQMELDALRRQREVVRQSQRARSAALSTATSQGAQQSTGLQGGFGQIGGQTGVNMLGITQNLELGREIFDANAAATASSSRYASSMGKYGTMAAFGQGLGTLGNAMTSNLASIKSIGIQNNPTGHNNPWMGYA